MVCMGDRRGVLYTPCFCNTLFMFNGLNTSCSDKSSLLGICPLGKCDVGVCNTPLRDSVFECAAFSHWANNYSPLQKHEFYFAGTLVDELIELFAFIC